MDRPVNGGADASSAPRSEATRAATDADWEKTVLSQTKNITADNPASDTSPLYSPDGRYIAYRAQQRPGYESDRFRLMLYDRKTGEKKDLTDRFDQWVGTYHLGARFEVDLFQLRAQTPFFDLRGRYRNRTSRRTMVGGYNDELSIYTRRKDVAIYRMSLKPPTKSTRRAQREKDVLQRQEM